ncbi:MAG TPA: hypothetical protein VEX36_08330 [Thermoleophilaceae bacterium]|nr:hypothetical protein [Thermoleophilaceae bacterium]
MADLTAQRTLVKSTPELWSELSEVESLAKHLGELGEIRITKVEPETTVAWEGEQISGTVELEQSGWGTRVTFRATVPEPDPPRAPEPVASEPEPAPEPVAVEPTRAPDPPAVEPAVVLSEPDPPSEPAPTPKRERGGFLARWLFRDRRPVKQTAASVASAPETLPAEPTTVEMDAVAIPIEALEDEPQAVQPERVEPADAPPALDEQAERVQAILDGTLEALGQAHHRPFSRG